MRDYSNRLRELRGASGAKPVYVIVQYNVPPLLSHRSRVQGCGGSIKKDLGLIKGFKVSVPANRLADLSNGPDVKYVSPDRPLRGTLNNSAPAVNAPYAWGLGFDANGIAVAVIHRGLGSKQTGCFQKSRLHKDSPRTSRILPFPFSFGD